jgi:hypothetical protein
MWNVKKRVGLE